MENTTEKEPIKMGEWYGQLMEEAHAGKHSLEDLYAMLEEKPMVYLIALSVIKEKKLPYTQEIHERLTEAMERYEKRQDIKDLIYLTAEKLLKNGKA